MTSRFLAPILAMLLAATSLPDLFQKAKEQFKLGSYEKALATLATLDADSQKPELIKQREALLPGLLFYRAASLAGLGREKEAVDQFAAFLVLRPNTTLDPTLYSKAIVGALEKARQASSSAGSPRPEEMGALASAYRSFTMPTGNPPEGSDEGWSQGPARWLLTPSEAHDYEALSDPVSRSEFITNFWKARDPVPETAENEFRQEFERRVAFADAHFAQNETRGSLTDRGMVFLLLGPPSYNGRKELHTGDDIADASGLSRYSRSEKTAAEQPGSSNTIRAMQIEKTTGPGTTVDDASKNWVDVWHYLRRDLPKEIPDLELDFDFVTKSGYGKNVLQRDPKVLNAIDRAKKPLHPRDGSPAS